MEGNQRLVNPSNLVEKYNSDRSEYNNRGKLRSETHYNTLISQNGTNEIISIMSDKFYQYEKRVNEMETSDKKVILKGFIYI